MDALLYWVGMAAVAVNALTGVLDSGRKQMDLIGALLVGVATALGGGTIRDLLLDRNIFWVADQAYLVTALGTGLATIFHRPLASRAAEAVSDTGRHRSGTVHHCRYPGCTAMAYPLAGRQSDGRHHRRGWWRLARYPLQRRSAGLSARGTVRHCSLDRGTIPDRLARKSACTG